MLFIFSTPEFIRHLWQLKTVVFLHWCLMCAVHMFIVQATGGGRFSFNLNVEGNKPKV